MMTFSMPLLDGNVVTRIGTHTHTDFARMTDEANSSVVLAELQFALFRECNNQRLSPWGRPFSCSPEIVTDLC